MWEKCDGAVCVERWCEDGREEWKRKKNEEGKMGYESEMMGVECEVMRSGERGDNEDNMCG